MRFNSTWGIIVCIFFSFFVFFFFRRGRSYTWKTFIISNAGLTFPLPSVNCTISFIKTSFTLHYFSLQHPHLLSIILWVFLHNSLFFHPPFTAFHTTILHNSSLSLSLVSSTTSLSLYYYPQLFLSLYYPPQLLSVSLSIIHNFIHLLLLTGRTTYLHLLYTIHFLSHLKIPKQVPPTLSSMQVSSLSLSLWPPQETPSRFISPWFFPSFSL